MASKEQLRLRWEGRGNLLGKILELCQRGEAWETALHGLPFVDEVTGCRDLRGAPLAGAELVGADLSAADLSDADLRAADLSEAVLTHANLSEVRAAEATLWRADLGGAALRDIDLTKANAYQGNFRGACLDGAQLVEAYFEQANLHGASLVGANLFGTRLPRANLSMARLSGARAEGADFADADLSEADLEEANLPGALFAGAFLMGAVLRRANLAAADLSRTDLSGAELRGAGMRDVDLSYARLQGADLSMANLERANLQDANCRNTLWAHANIEGANLTGAAVYNSSLFLARGLATVTATQVDVGAEPERPSLRSWSDFVNRLRGLYADEGPDASAPRVAVDGQSPTLPSAAAIAGQASSPLFSHGSHFGRYVIEDLLGEGGMGRVYRALDTRLGRRIALKVLPASDRTSNASSRSRRFEREARATALIDSPYAVAVFDVGDVDGHPFIAMELVNGRTLTHYVRELEPDWPVRVRWLTQIGSALAAAHRVGIVHRDVKPENVMIREDGVAKVLDFGIARRLMGNPDESGETIDLLSTVTVEGVPIGTPLYMAPEQLRGESVDGRTDQFAWGVTAYELLASRSPWVGNSYSILAKILTEAAPPLRSIQPAVPEGVARVVARAMSKARDARYPTMDGLVANLAPFAEAEGELELRLPGQRQGA